MAESDRASTVHHASAAKWGPETVARIAAHHGITVDEVTVEHLAGFEPDETTEGS